MTTPGPLKPVTFQNIGSQPVQICPSNSGPVNIYNGDITDVLLVSPSWNPGLTNSYPIQPLTNGTVDGTSALYAVAQSGVVSTITVGGASQLSPSPAQIAAQISALGLATAANQVNQINEETTIANNTGAIAASSANVQANTGNIAVSSAAIEGSNNTLVTNTQDTVNNINITNDFVGGTTPSALLANAGLTVGQEIAALIASGSATGTPGGTPLLSGYSNTAKAGPTNVGPGASGSVVYNITSPGYIISVSAVYIANGSEPFADFLMIWQDNAGNIIDQESWTIPVSSVGQAVTVFGKGPTKGATLRVRFINHDPAQTIAFSYNINQTTHHIARDDWRQINGQGAGFVPGQTYPPIANAFGNLLGASTPAGVAIAAGSSAAFLLPVYAGQVALALTATQNYLVQLLPFNGNFTGGIPAIFAGNVSAANALNAFAALPRMPCQINIQNTNSAAGVVTFGVTALELVS